MDLLRTVLPHVRFEFRTNYRQTGSNPMSGLGKGGVPTSSESFMIAKTHMESGYGTRA